MGTKIDIKNIEQFIARLENKTPFLNDVAKLLKAKAVNRITTTKIDPYGKAWPQWAVATARARAKRGTAGRGLLYESGRLSNGITAEVQGNQAIVGVQGVPYASFLQNGTNKMPARKFLGISQQDEVQIKTMLVKYLKGTQ